MKSVNYTEKARHAKEWLNLLGKRVENLKLTLANNGEL